MSDPDGEQELVRAQMRAAAGRAAADRDFRQLLERSSLGSPGARRHIAAARRHSTRMLTGMAEEQADWDEQE